MTICCCNRPVYSEDGLELHLASGSAIYDIVMETGSVVEDHEGLTELVDDVNTEVARSSTAKIASGHSVGSTISSVRFVVPPEACDFMGEQYREEMSEYRKGCILTSGTDNRVIFWKKILGGWKPLKVDLRRISPICLIYLHGVL